MKSSKGMILEVMDAVMDSEDDVRVADAVVIA